MTPLRVADIVGAVPTVVVLLFLPIFLLLAAVLVVCLVLSHPYRMFRDRREAETSWIGRPLGAIEYVFAERVDRVSAHYTAGSCLRGLGYLVVCPIGWLSIVVVALLVHTFGSYD